ncbi:MAG: 5-amino-6-(D-ribitylamino)uracil--L-tyrosine 4-hydroxyphenyl transferase CofH [Blastochloris sp.]|nr:5-amino-6-(D-ribitylamino)uracil--L-tyrosine 4-hydroxyphenyl transferase CofH [Blastochloris sp.]
MNLWDAPTSELQEAARELNSRLHSGVVTYVVNRNANFTNICNVGCTFCGFQRKASDSDAYIHTPGQIVQRLEQTPWITEVCLQGGIHPGLSFDYYLDLVRQIKLRFPEIHIHAFSPMEIEAMHQSSKLSHRSILIQLQEAGLDSIPGTAAEILVDEVRRRVSGNKLSSQTWEDIIRCAHGLGIPSTCTVMYGHIETWDHIRQHFERLKNIQSDTGGFTELVPLAFIPYKNRLGKVLGTAEKNQPLDFQQFEARSLHIAERLYPLARLYFDSLIPNLQTSWVKLGLQLASQSLHWGCNDFGGTLYEESITRESGGQHGECLTPQQIEQAILSAGFQPLQRHTLYSHQTRSQGFSFTLS